MPVSALEGITIVDVSGTIATAYCCKNFADYGAEVINLEPIEGFSTRTQPPFLSSQSPPENSALHAYLSTNKQSVCDDGALSPALTAKIANAHLVVDDGTATSTGQARMSISWFGGSGPMQHNPSSDAQMFALNGMLRTIGAVEGPPIIPTGFQAQIVGGAVAFIAAMAYVLGRELGNTEPGAHLETSIFEAMLCFTEVGVVGAYNTGLESERMGVNRFPPTYPLGVFPCQDGWIGLTVLTPSQWHSFCALLDLPEFAEVALFQSSVGRLAAVDVIEPIIREKLLSFSAEALFYQAQRQRVPLARVPSMEELLEVDQFSQRQAFTTATIGENTLTVPATPFRLHETPPHFGGPVATLGQHNLGQDNLGQDNKVS